MGWEEVGSGLATGREWVGKRLGVGWKEVGSGWKEVGSGLERGREWVGKRGWEPGQGRAGQGAGQGRAGQGAFPRHACTSISTLGLVCLVKVLGFRVCAKLREQSHMKVVQHPV